MEQPMYICWRCKKREVEWIDDWHSDCCGPCNDRQIEVANERAEFVYYHPSTRED